ncbi:phosphoethanolamine transferase [Prevotella sp.]|uniref:phosphoethanolamine transferase n=1 Tax=Prevotella sp. TaxID=59823 RepID=UPI002F93EE17
MTFLKTIGKAAGYLFRPIQVNALFFVFMYLLGCVCAWTTLPHYKGAHLYENLYLELFIDLYLCCLFLTIIPKKLRRWLRLLLYIVLYATALADVYCFTKFDSTLNPSILMLIGETDSREAGDFLSSVLSLDVIFSNVGWVLLLMIVNLLCHYLPRRKRVMLPRFRFKAPLQQGLGLLTAVLLTVSAACSWHNKAATAKLMSGKTIGEVEHTLTEKDHAVLYLPIYRLIFSVYANSLAAQQVDQLIAAADKVTVDSCVYRSPNIVLIIGESYGKHHSGQYGYFMNTTPRQSKLEKSGRLVKFNDVVSCWNLTSFVFKNVLSTHVVGQKGEWCDYPLFPELFRKAGYQVTFLTNQFLAKANQAVYDFSGGFFLNNPTLSKYQFDLRNDALYPYDDGLLQCYDDFAKAGKIKPNNLTIFHLLGQHVNYKQRYPRDRTYFWASSYEDKRPELTHKQRKVLSQYDNACLYNDSIVDQIVKRFEDKEAIVIYMPDHGEECYEGNRGFICRNHSSAIDYDLARYEFEIPFWIYCSPRYIHAHPDIYRQIVQARNRRFMTDALPHLLLYLAGIHAKDYQERHNVLSEQYDEMRPRILKGTTDYDKLRNNSAVTHKD